MLLVAAGRLMREGFGFPVDLIELPAEAWKSIIRGIEEGLHYLTDKELQVIKLRYDFEGRIEEFRKEYGFKKGGIIPFWAIGEELGKSRKPQKAYTVEWARNVHNTAIRKLRRLPGLMDLFGPDRMVFSEFEKVNGPFFPLSWQDLMKKPVGTLRLSVRSTNALQAAGVDCVGDVVEKGDEELLALKNFGRKSLNELRSVLAELGLSSSM